MGDMTPIIQQMLTSIISGGQQAQSIQSTMNQMQTIQTQMYAEARKGQQDRWKLLQDLQQHIFQTYQDVTLDRAKKADENLKRWNGFIKGGRD